MQTPMQTPTPLERRVAPDGQLYTQTQFVTYYGGTSEWDAAATHQVDLTSCIMTSVENAPPQLHCPQASTSSPHTLQRGQHDMLEEMARREQEVQRREREVQRRELIRSPPRESFMQGRTCSHVVYHIIVLATIGAAMNDDECFDSFRQSVHVKKAKTASTRIVKAVLLLSHA